MKAKKFLSSVLTVIMLLTLSAGLFTAHASGMATTIYLRPHSTTLQMFSEIEGAYFHILYMSADGMGEMNMERVDNYYFKAEINRNVDFFEFRLKDEFGGEFWMVNAEYNDSSYNCANFVSEPAVARWTKFTPQAQKTQEPSEPSNPDVTVDIKALYFLPNTTWARVDGTYRARFLLTDGTEEWVDLTSFGTLGYYFVSTPETFKTVVFCVIPQDMDNTLSSATYISETFSPTSIKGNCLTLNENTGTSRTTKGTWSTKNSADLDGNTPEPEVAWGESSDQLTNEGTFSSAITKNNVYIKLLKDIELTSNVTFSRASTLDLSGHNIYITDDNASITVHRGAAIDIKDSLGTGAVTVSDNDTRNAPMIVVNEDGFLNIHSGRFITDNSSILRIDDSSSVVNIFGGEFISKRYNHLINLKNGTLNIYGGKFISGAETNTSNENRLKSYVDVNINSGSVYVNNYDESADVFSVRKQYNSQENANIYYNDQQLMLSNEQGLEINAEELSYAGTVGIFSHPKTILFYDAVGSENVVRTDRIAGFIDYIFPASDFLTPPDSMEFSNWVCNGQNYNTGDTYEITDSDVIDIYPVWKNMQSYNVTYHANNGTNETITKAEWNTFTLPDYPSEWTVPEGYYFTGWSKTENGASQVGQITIDGQTDLYAKFAKLSYTVKYNGNGDDISFSKKEYKLYDEDYTITAEVPTKNGYTFKGWAQIPDGEVKYQVGDIYSENKDLTLYAIWKIENFKVFTFNRAENTATFLIPEAGVYTVVFADYNGERLVNISLATIEAKGAGKETAVSGIYLGSGDKIMLLNNITSLTPLCSEMTLK